MNSRPLPPFGIELRRWLRSDPKPKRWGCNGNEASITIAFGSDAWGFARQWNEIRLVLVVPPGEFASRFNWRDCAGAAPVLIQSCGEVAAGAIDSLVNSLLRDGIERVLDVDSGTEFFAGAARHAA